MNKIHIFIGTKAQYIKTAPLIRLLDERGIDYRLIDSGQHAELSKKLRTELGIREPDYFMGDGSDVVRISQAMLWSLKIAAKLISKKKVKSEIFGGFGGICVVHGDTPSTLLSALLARRAGIKVAHIEAGLRSRSIFHPFPEELIRLVVMRVSNVLFAPDETAVKNLEKMGLGKRVVPVSGNTVIEALRYSLKSDKEPGLGVPVVTTHRVENVTNSGRLDAIVDIVLRISEAQHVKFIVHGPTIAALKKQGRDVRLEEKGVELIPLIAHAEFVELLYQAPFVITDGGSIQEECAIIGVPTLLWRARTERPDGIGRNIVLSDYETSVVDQFLDSPSKYRYPLEESTETPSQQILDELLKGLEATK